MKSPKEIVDALKVIKDVCDESGHCSACPLKGIEYNTCALKITPNCWEINDPDRWTAF